jgi:hypothetical protein
MPEGNVTGVDLQDVSVSSGQQNVNVYNQGRDKRSLEERVEDLERMIYGEPRWSEPGLIKRQQRQLWVSQVNMAINGLTLALLALYLLWS